MSLDAAPETAAAIEVLRGRGAQVLDPVRYRHIEALARRAAAHQGQTRDLLEAKLRQLVAACADACAQARSPAGNEPGPTPTRATLQDLRVHLARHAANPAAGGGAEPIDPNAVAELRTVRSHRSTWSRLIVDQRLAQSLAAVPRNAGPLNTQRLLHQALTVMRDASPEYVQRFMAHVEALLWLDPDRPAGAMTKRQRVRNAGDGTAPAGRRG